MYEGDLIHYFNVLFKHASNLCMPYHNFRHMFHVLWNCHLACEYYENDLSLRERRNLLIAAMFHDFDHSGRMGNDDINIMIAIRGLRTHVMDIDRPHMYEIETMIEATQYPYTVSSDNIDLCAKILRDADVSQALSVAWIQQVVFGLAQEWKKPIIEVLKIQAPFISSLRFNTDWAQKTFHQEVLDAKITEARELVALIYE